MMTEARERARRAAIRTAIKGHRETLGETVEALRELAAQDDSHRAITDLEMAAR
jgi:hypothetical protein